MVQMFNNPSDLQAQLLTEQHELRIPTLEHEIGFFPAMSILVFLITWKRI